MLTEPRRLATREPEHEQKTGPVTSTMNSLPPALRSKTEDSFVGRFHRRSLSDRGSGSRHQRDSRTKSDPIAASSDSGAPKRSTSCRDVFNCSTDQGSRVRSTYQQTMAIRHAQIGIPRGSRAAGPPFAIPARTASYQLLPLCRR